MQVNGRGYTWQCLGRGGWVQRMGFEGSRDIFVTWDVTRNQWVVGPQDSFISRTFQGSVRICPGYKHQSRKEAPVALLRNDSVGLAGLPRVRAWLCAEWRSRGFHSHMEGKSLSPLFWTRKHLMGREFPLRVKLIPDEVIAMPRKWPHSRVVEGPILRDAKF